MAESLTYLLLLLAWALPVIALHWCVGAPELRAHARLLLVAVLVPTIYLSLADAVAIDAGIWSISEELTVGWQIGTLVFEEVVFFLLTNVLVAQSIILFLSPSARARAQHLAGRALNHVRRPRRRAATEQPAASDSPNG